MAISIVQVGSATVTSSDTLVVPVTADVAASDPTLGATILLPFFIPSFSTPPELLSVTDDAPPAGLYGDCYFGDGLNHYIGGELFPPLGLILNPLVGGVTNVTLAFNAVASFLACTLYAITGVNLPISSAPAPPPDFLVTDVFHTSESPTGSPAHFGDAVQWGWFFGPLAIGNPSGAADEGWDWQAGEQALYIVSDNEPSSGHLGWTWADGSISDFDQSEHDGGDGHFYSLAAGLATVTPGSPAPSLDGAWGAGDTQFSAGVGWSFLSGPGPAYCTTPPPAPGNPTFNTLVPV